MSEEHPANEIEVLLQVGAALSEPRTAEVDAIPHLVLPPNHQVAGLEHLLPHPKRLRAKPTLADVDSFLAYVNAFKDAGSRVFADGDAHRIVAALDYHQTIGQPSHVEHVATLQLKLSPQWQTWIGANRSRMKQVDFAEFVETNVVDVVEPAGAELLEMASHLETHRTVRFTSGVRLSDGKTNLLYDEQLGGRDGKGEVQLPKEFVLAIPVYEGEPVAYKLRARLRWRIDDDGRPAFWYDLLRADEVRRAAFADVAKRVVAGTSGLVVLNGSMR